MQIKYRTNLANNSDFFHTVIFYIEQNEDPQITKFFGHNKPLKDPNTQKHIVSKWLSAKWGLRKKTNLVYRSRWGCGLLADSRRCPHRSRGRLADTAA
jgi:hypothetical protein